MSDDLRGFLDDEDDDEVGFDDFDFDNNVIADGGGFTLTDGTFDVTSNNIQVRGGWAQNGGTFDPRNRTVTFNGSAAQTLSGGNFYNITFEKPGGLVMPIIVEYTYADGTTKMEKYPAQIWRYNDSEVNKAIASEKEIVSIVVDPNQKTADIDTSNNTWPQEAEDSEFDTFKNEVRN